MSLLLFFIIWQGTPGTTITKNLQTNCWTWWSGTFGQFHQSVFTSGLTGVGWGIDFLVKNKFVDADSNGYIRRKGKPLDWPLLTFRIATCLVERSKTDEDVKTNVRGIRKIGLFELLRIRWQWVKTPCWITNTRYLPIGRMFGFYAKPTWAGVAPARCFW